MARSSCEWVQSIRRRPKPLLTVAFVLIIVLAATWLFARYRRSQSLLSAAERSAPRFELGTAQRHIDDSLKLWSTRRALFLQAQIARRREAHADAERLLTAYEQAYGKTEDSELEWRLLGVQQGDMAAEERPLQRLVDQQHTAAILILEALAKGYQNTLRLPQMVNALDILLEEAPDQVAGLALRARGFEGLRQYERALADYRRAVALAPECDEARLGLAELLTRLGQWPEAVAQWEALRRRLPDEPAVLLGLARCRFDDGKLSDAARLLDELLARQPDHAAALVDRGLLALQSGQASDAETVLARATKLAPWHRPARRAYGQCLEARGKLEPAEAGLEAIEASDRQAGSLWLDWHRAPRDPGPRCGLGLWCLNNGEEQIGVRWLFSALLLESRHTATHAALADYFQRTGQPRRAEHHAAWAGR